MNNKKEFSEITKTLKAIKEAHAKIKMNIDNGNDKTIENLTLDELKQKDIDLPETIAFIIKEYGDTDDTKFIAGFLNMLHNMVKNRIDELTKK